MGNAILGEIRNRNVIEHDQQSHCLICGKLISEKDHKNPETRVLMYFDTFDDNEELTYYICEECLCSNQEEVYEFEINIMNDISEKYVAYKIGTDIVNKSWIFSDLIFRERLKTFNVKKIQKTHKEILEEYI